MSDPVENAPIPEKRPAEPASPATDKPQPKPAKARKWRRRLLRTFLILLAITLLLRSSLFFLVPWAINRAASAYNLQCSYEKMDLYLVDGDVGIWHLKISPKEGGSPLAQAEYCRGDISTFQLLRGRLVVQQLVADGVELNVERKIDGSIPLLARLLAGRPATKPTGPTKINLSPPLQIDAMRLLGIRAHLSDQAVSPPLEAQIDLDVRLSDLAVASRPARFRIEISSNQMLDVLRIEGQGTSAAQAVDSSFQVFLRGLHPKAAAAYLQPMGIRPVAENLAMTMTAHLTTAAAGTPGDQISAKLSVDNLSVVADDRQAIGVDHLLLATGPIGTGSADLGTLSIDGVKLASGREPGGALRAAGFELIARAPQPPAAASVARPTISSSRIPWSMTRITVSKFDALFYDETLSPPITLHAQIPELLIKDMGATPGAPALTLKIKTTLVVPGVLRSLQLNGTASPFADLIEADLDVQADGINPQAIGPYLHMLGLRSLLKDASLHCKLVADLTQGAHGALTANAHLQQIRLRDATDLLTLDDVIITGASTDVAMKAVRVKDVRVVGPSLAAKRDPDGALEGLGFRLDPAIVWSPSSRAAVSSASAPSPAAALVLPKIDIDHFSWKGTRVQFSDDAMSPPTAFDLSDLLVELSDLHIDPAGKPGDSPPGKLNIHLAIKGLADEVKIQGNLSPAPGGMSADLEVVGNHLQTVALAPYLQALDIEPLIRDGGLHLNTVIALSSTNDGLKASASLTDLSLNDGGVEILGLASAKISDLSIGPSRIEAAAIEISNPRLTVGRDESGAFLAAGVRQIPNQPAPPAALVGSLATTGPVPTTIATTPPPLPVIEVHRLVLNNADVKWKDRAVQPSVDASAKVSAQLDQIVFGPGAAPATVKLSAQVTGILDQVTVDGTLAGSPQSIAANIAIDATGIHEGQLVSYLPPGTRINLADGRFRAKLDAAVSRHDLGGDQVRVRVTDLDYRDGADGPTLLRFDSAGIIAARLDPAGGVCAFDEITLSGLETGMTKLAGNETRLLGLSLAPPSQVAPATQPAPANAMAISKPASTQPAPSAMQIVTNARKALPLVTLEKLDLNFKQISITDQTRPQAAPIKIVQTRLTNRGRIELLGPDAESHPAVALELAGQLSPIADSFNSSIDLKPFAARPTFKVDLAASGIKGEGLTALLPELKPQIDGSALTDGRLRLHLDGQASLYRRSPLDIDLSRGFELEFSLKSLEYRSGENGPLLGGIEEIRSDAIHVDPARELVQIRSLEITRPAASIAREKDGVHAFGLLIKVPATQPSAPADQPSVVAEPTAAPTQQESDTSAKPAGEIRISRLLVSGLDVRFEDHSVAPQLVVPLNNLDVDVRDLSSRAMFEEQPIRFSVLMNAGAVPLPKRSTQGAFTGAMNDLQALSAGKNVQVARELEQRDLFSQIEASGKISLYPRPKGWIKTSVSGMELAALKGSVGELGIGLEDGTFDESIDIRMPGDGSMDTRSRFVFTDLQMSEPPNGPIFRYLHLPAPLDVVIAALRDQDGALTVPLDVPVRNSAVSGGDIAGAAVGAFGAIVAKAIASAPAKAASAVADTVADTVGAFIPIPFLIHKKEPEKPLTLTFAPGDAALDRTEMAALAQVAERLRKDPSLELTVRHKLAESDVALAALRANPSPQDCLGLARQLRQRRDTLLAARAEFAGAARTTLVAGTPPQATLALARLRQVERDIASTDDSLDQLYELLRPGANRQASRRTRQASLDIGQSRLEAIRAALAIPDAHRRVHLVRPQFDAAGSTGGGQVTLLVIKKKS